MTTYLATGGSNGIFGTNDRSTGKGLGIHKAEWSQDATCDWLRSRNSPIILSSPGSRDTSANNSIFRDSLEVYKQNNRINHSNTFIDVFIYLKDWWGCVKWWHFYAFYLFFLELFIFSTTTKREKQRKRREGAGLLWASWSVVRFSGQWAETPFPF